MHYSMTADDTKSGNLTVRVYPAQKSQIERAAKAAGKTASLYCLEILMPRAAEDLGEELIDIYPERGRHNSAVQRMARELDAARKLGLTAQQLADVEARYRAKTEVVLGLRAPRKLGIPTASGATGITRDARQQPQRKAKRGKKPA